MLKAMVKTRIEISSPYVKSIHYGDILPEILYLKRVSPEKERAAFPEEKPSRRLILVCYTARGWQTCHVGGKYFYLPEDHFLFIPPGESLSAGDKAGTDSKLYLIAIRLPGKEREGDFLGLSHDERGGLFLLLSEMASPVIRTDRSMGDVMESIYRNSMTMATADQDKPVLTTIRVKNLYRELFLTLSEGSPVLGNALDSLIDSVLPRLPEGGYSPLIGRAISQMAENLYDGLTLVSLADGVNISLSRFKARFREETGLSPLEFYTRLSIQKSLVLLHQTDHTVEVISRDLGFSSPRYFSTIFQKNVGMEPEEFRGWRGRFS